jgi:hypothetical protein
VAMLFAGWRAVVLVVVSGPWGVAVHGRQLLWYAVGKRDAACSEGCWAV